ncbi:uncharacterized protein LOC128393164 [Panonychus citri]|uniref:uncharacterized protein LOC128393164 n=1 Tax=Panonychus citri TaxID=50023 RepID=UPI002307EFE6|nr:uncharacterized protein LOC128393164 [Panonychus citri]
MFDNLFFSSLNAFNFVSSITECDDGRIAGTDFAEHFELLPLKPLKRNQYFCFLTNECLGYLNPTPRSTAKLNYLYRCSVCKQYISPTRGTCFEKMRIDLLDFYKVVFLWCGHDKNKRVLENINLNKNTIVDYFQFCREVALDVLIDLGEIIGGEDRHVEIDESVLFKRKYRKGRLLANQSKQVWVVGGIERETGHCFVEIAPNRKMPTLDEIIQRKVQTGTTIFTDEWRGYNNLKNLGYIHYTVNHSKNFLNPHNKTIHTQTIERLWKGLKESSPKQTNGSKRSEYLIDYLFRRRFFHGKNPGERFNLMIEYIANQYRSELFNNANFEP